MYFWVSQWVFKSFNIFQILLLGTESNATNSRVFIEAHDVNVTSWTTDTYCNETVAPPVEEFHMIVKKGKIFYIYNRVVYLSTTTQTFLTKLYRGMVTILFKIIFLCLMSTMLQKGFCNGQPIVECQWSCNKRVTEFTTLCHVNEALFTFWM